MNEHPESVTARAGDKSLTIRGNVGLTMQAVTLLVVAFGAAMISNILENQRSIVSEFRELEAEFKQLEEQAVLSFKADEQLLNNIRENRQDMQAFLLKYAEDYVAIKSLLDSIDRSDKDILRLVETALLSRSFAVPSSPSRHHSE